MLDSLLVVVIITNRLLCFLGSADENRQATESPGNPGEDPSGSGASFCAEGLPRHEIGRNPGGGRGNNGRVLSSLRQQGGPGLCGSGQPHGEAPPGVGRDRSADAG